MKPLTRHWRDDLICHDVRDTTNKLLDMVDDGSLNARDLALMCLKWMSEDDVKAMAKANELLEDEEDDAE